MGVLAGGANWGCYGPSLVPVLPQAPGGAQHPQPLLRYGPAWRRLGYTVRVKVRVRGIKSATRKGIIFIETMRGVREGVGSGGGEGAGYLSREREAGSLAHLPTGASRVHIAVTRPMGARGL